MTAAADRFREDDEQLAEWVALNLAYLTATCAPPWTDASAKISSEEQ